EEELPAGVSIRDLGERRLKDLERPERIFQLVIQGLQSDFAQLKTLDVELRRKRRRMYAGSALIGVVAAAVAIPVFALGQGSSGGSLTVRGNAVAEIDPSSNQVVGQVPVGARPDAIAYGAGGLWVANLDDETVSHVDPTTGEAVRAIPIGDAVSGLSAGRNAIWAVSADPPKPYAVLRRIDPRFDVVAKSLRVQAGALLSAGGLGEPATGATGPGAVRVGTDPGLLQRVDPARTALAKTV